MSSPTAEKEAVIRLNCPGCSGGLNLRRKHLGISGACVHCHTPITAVESGGAIVLRRSDEIEAEKAAAAETAAAPMPVAESEPAPMPDPRPVASPEAVEAAAVKPESAPPSGWGFPQREESLPMAKVEPEAPKAASAKPPAFDLSAFETESAPVKEVAAVPPMSPPSFGFSDDVNREGAGKEAEQLKEATSEVESSNEDDLFDSGENPSVSGLFTNQNAVESGWGAKVPSQNHASISPFSTGSAEPEEELGFAETLFREKAKEDTGEVQPKSPFGNLDDDCAPIPAGALFGASREGVKKTEPQEEAILDGDGRPLRPMTPQEKEQFAGEIMHFGEYRKRSPWITRIVKFVATIAVLGGIGYGAYVFLPQEQVEVAKAKVLEWLEPGSVLMDYLPFELGASEDGSEKKVKIKALEGLDNLSSQMDSYLGTAEEQLNSTLPEGAEDYEREAPVDTPEMPEIPKLPFKLGSSEEVVPAVE
ncbi:MAG: hypothetical protein P1U68_02830 [Verrucomicrobiales bacterium]|nr:hypothetical protein [Verrucomicrobiales bacterium]